MDNSTKSESKPEQNDPKGPVVEVIEAKDFVSFNDSECTHPEPWTRDETEELGNAMTCANPKCHVIFML